MHMPDVYLIMIQQATRQAVIESSNMSMQIGLFNKLNTMQAINTLTISGIVRDIPKFDGKGNFECQGTKHFSPGSKIFVLSPIPSYDMCCGRIKVIGVHKEDGNVCEIWFNNLRAHQWALEHITDPELLKYHGDGWDRNHAEGMLKYLLFESNKD